jgi:hypothetical protein
LLLEYEMKIVDEDRFQLMFKPVHYAIHEKFSYDVCKGIILQEHLRSGLFLDSLQDRLITPFEETEVPFKYFGIPKAYFFIKEALCSFLRKEITVVKVGEAYSELSKAKLTIKNGRCQKVLDDIVEIIILKGLYYLKVLSEYNCSDCQGLVTSLSAGLDRLLEAKGETEFAFVCITIKSSIPLFTGQKKLSIAPQSGIIQDHYEYFSEQFKFWIGQHKKFDTLDETNFFQGSPAHSKIRIGL